MMSTAKTPVLARVAMLVAISAVLVFILGVQAAYAATLPQLSSDAEAYPRTGVPVPVRVTLDQTAATRDKALEVIQQYRLEAYNEGLVSLPSGMTKDQYVYGITWDVDLERVAVQRAIERSIAPSLAHTRPTGKWFNNAASNGVSPSTESLASIGTGRKHNANLGMQEFLRSAYGIERGLNMWHSEITYRRSNLTKGTNYNCGHYLSMVDPKYTRFGVACAGVEWSTEVTWALEARGGSGSNNAAVGYKGEYDAVVYANDNGVFDVSLYPYCVDGGVKPGTSSWIRLRGASGLTENSSWDIDSTYATFESSNPRVVSVSDNGRVTGILPGVATITVTMGKEVATVTIPVTSELPVFRLYNPYSGEHFYTYNAEEHASLVSIGWRPEGLGWVAPSSSKTPVYRLYNPYAGEHHYTTDKKERDMLVRVGWNDEGIGWYSDDAKGAPLYRQYNPNAFACNHNYTTSKEENDYLASIGWRAEGIGWYGLSLESRNRALRASALEL